MRNFMEPLTTLHDTPETLILSRLKGFPGKTACYFQNLLTGETVSWHADEAFLSASVIKLFVLLPPLSSWSQEFSSGRNKSSFAKQTRYHPVALYTFCMKVRN